MSTTVTESTPVSLEATSTSKGTSARKLVALCVVLFVLGVLGGTGVLASIGRGAMQLFELYAESQLAMIAASGNVTADGEAEYAVMLGGFTLADVERGLADDASIRYRRESVVPGWVVVGIDDGDRDALDRLKALDHFRLVIPNRGVWICH